MASLLLFMLCMCLASTEQGNGVVGLHSSESISDPLAEKFSEMEQFVVKQKNKLSALRILALKQDTEILTLQQRLREQDTEVETLKDHLPEPRVGKQQPLDSSNRVDSSKVNSNEAGSYRQETAQLDQTEELVLMNQNTDTVKSGVGFNEESVKSVDVRSDDGGPFEAVVAELSQHINLLDADLQAFTAHTANQIHQFTTSTNNQINLLQSQTTANINALNHTNNLQQLAIQYADTSVFTHWGSTACGRTSELLYAGAVGGSPYNETGAAVNFLCLTMEPVFLPAERPRRYFGAHLFGTEYQTSDAHDDMDAVCAVCRAPYSTTIMVPGTNACESGWHLQYWGYLMTGGYNDAAGSEYICVDRVFESADHSIQDQDGKSLFYTSTYCSSLPCTPYVQASTVLCAVCSM